MGDLVQVETDRIGALANPVVAVPAAAFMSTA